MERVGTMICQRCRDVEDVNHRNARGGQTDAVPTFIELLDSCIPPPHPSCLWWNMGSKSRRGDAPRGSEEMQWIFIVDVVPPQRAEHASTWRKQAFPPSQRTSWHRMLHRHPSTQLGSLARNTTVEANQEMQALHMLGRPYLLRRIPWRIEAWPPDVALER